MEGVCAGGCRGADRGLAANPLKCFAPRALRYVANVVLRAQRWGMLWWEKGGAYGLVDFGGRVAVSDRTAGLGMGRL